MPTQHDYYEALREGRWRPEIEIEGDEDKGYKATYRQGHGEVLTVESPYKWQVEGDLMEKLSAGVLEGKYFPDLT